MSGTEAHSAGRVEWVDAAKGLGIVLVVVGHVIRSLFHSSLADEHGTAAFLDQWIYAFHMPMFFVLSGLFLPRAFPRPAAVFFADKCRTILYPYVVWATLQTGLQVVMSRYTNAHETWRDVLAIPVIPPMQFWFLYTLFASTVLLWLVWRAGGGAAGAVLAGLALFALLIHVGTFDWPVVPMVQHNTIFLAVGVAIGARGLTSRIGSAPWPVLLAAAVTGLGVVTIAVERSWLGGAWHDLGIALAGSAGAAALSVLLARAPGARAWKLLGRRSLEIYVAHSMTAAGVRIVFHKFLGISAVALHAPLEVAVGLGVPVVLAILAERVGFPYLFRWPTARSPSPEGMPGGYASGT